MRGIRRLTLGIIAVTLVALSGCVVIESSAISETQGKGSAVTAETDDMGILRLSIPPNLTHKANAALLAQCARGKLTDVQTELSMRDFLIIQLYHVSAEGICQ
jgi:hypothetical protein